MRIAPALLLLREEESFCFVDGPDGITDDVTKAACLLGLQPGKGSVPKDLHQRLTLLLQGILVLFFGHEPGKAGIDLPAEEANRRLVGCLQAVAVAQIALQGDLEIRVHRGCLM